jgi:hypothetical protein
MFREDSFSARWMRAVKGGRAFTLPADGRGGILVQSGVAKRVSKCHICETPIVAGERRIEFFIRYGSWRTYKSGGSSGRICYVHPDCFAKALDDSEPVVPKRRDPNRCVNCGRITKHGYSVFDDDDDMLLSGLPSIPKPVLKDPGRRALPFIASASIMTYICEDCSKQPMYRCCEHCGLWSYKRRMTAKADGTGYLCYHCDDELEIIGRLDEYVTARSMKRERDLWNRARRGYEQAEAWVNEFRTVR